MNETYLSVMFTIIVATIIIWCFVDDIIGTMVLTIASVVMFTASVIAPIGDDRIEIKPATNTRVGNELVIQAQGFSTQNISDIALIDKKVQVKKITTQNAWGRDLETTYIVEPIN
jgi:hypothetical protein